MKPEEALNLLDRTIAQLNVPRETHVKFQQAISSLKQAISTSDDNSGSTPDDGVDS